MIVLDASVAVKLLTLEVGADLALARVAMEQDRIAPDWIRAEVANVLARKVRKDGLMPSIAADALQLLQSYLTAQVDGTTLLDHAFALAIELAHDLYDCLYLALAIERRSIVLTADERFVKSATRGGYSDFVELLA